MQVTPAEKTPRRMRGADVVALAAVPAAAAALLALLGPLHWSFDLLSHFPLPCLLVLLGAAVALAALRRFVRAAAFAACAALPAVKLWPLFCGEALASAAPGAPVTALVANLYFENARVRELLAVVARESPDVIALSEVTHEHWAALESLGAGYPFRQVRASSGSMGIALLSRLPLRDAAVVPLGYDWAPAITAVVETPVGPVGVLCVHTPRPGGGRRTAERDRALAALPALLRALPPRCMVLGDCNATRWSAPFAAMLAAAGLGDSSDGMGYQGSWPAMLPWFLRIPIDQALVKGGIGVRRRQLGPDIGSDHLPLVVEFEVPRQ